MLRPAPISKNGEHRNRHSRRNRCQQIDIETERELEDYFGRARDKAAAAVGMGARTLEQMEKVVQKADEGDPTAQAAVDAVNRHKKSVDAAYQEVVTKAPITKLP
jgi:hypothetical protein